MVNYQQGKIYKIVCNITGLVYIGSTCENRLSRRLSHHVGHYKIFLAGKTNYTSSFEIIKNGNYEMVLIENFPCDNSDELRMRERFYKESQECVNVNNPIRLKEDDILKQQIYYQENKEKEKHRKQKFRIENIEKVKLRGQKYYEENKEKVNMRNNNYRLENKEKVKLSRQKYREENKEQIKINNKKYREENKEREYIRKQTYRKENKEALNFKLREKRQLKNIYLEQLKYYYL